MGSILTFLNSVKSFDIEKTAKESIKIHEKTILDFNREYLIEGKLSNGQPIRPIYANKYYAKKKQLMNNKPEYGTPDLKLSGKFHASLYLDGISVKSKDSKASWLEPKYNSAQESMYGINTKFVGNIRKLIVPEVAKKFKEHAQSN